MVIHKYKLEELAVQRVAMPTRCQFLHVGEQNGDLHVWFLVDENINGFANPMAANTFFIVGTGDTVPKEVCKHLGTVQMKSGLVLHVFI